MVAASPLVLGLGIALRVTLSIHYGNRGGSANDPVFVSALALSWVFILAGLLPLCLLSLFSVLGLVMGAIILFSVVDLVLAHRAAMREQVLEILRPLIGPRGQLDTSGETDSVRALQSLCSSGQLSGLVGRGVRKLAASLDQGKPLGDALAEAPAALSRSAGVFVAAGERMDAVPAMLSELSRPSPPLVISQQREAIHRLVYAAGLTITTLLMLFMIAAFQIDQLRLTYAEFSLEAPWIDAWLQFVSSPTVTLVLGSACFACVVVILLAPLIVLCYLLDFQVLAERIEGWLPMLPQRELLRMLALATERHAELVPVLQAIAVEHPSRRCRRRATRASHLIEAGAPIEEALTKSKYLTRSQGDVIKAARIAGNLPWALRTMAAQLDYRVMRQLTRWTHIVFPIALIGVSIAVGITAIATFLPLAMLIFNLT